MSRAAAVALGALILVLSGCAQDNSGPPVPTAAEQADHFEHMLDLTWSSSGLGDTAIRPRVAHAEPLDLDAWALALSSCMREAGFVDVGFGWAADAGYYLASEPVASGEAADFNVCVAEHPMTAGQDGFLVGRAQLDYVYDYFQRWTIPCLRSHNYAIRRVVSREEFARGMGEWRPYWELAIYDAKTYDEVVARCGPDRPPLR